MRSLRLLYIVCGLLVLTFVGSLFCRADGSDSEIKKDLVLVQMRVNGVSKGDSEVLVLEDKLYLPVKQLAQLSGVEVSYDRDSKRLAFVEITKGLPVVIEPISKTVRVGENLLDITSTPIYWMKQSISLLDEVLLSKELVEQFFDIKTEYKDDILVLEITNPRILKASGQAKDVKGFKAMDEEPADLVKPKKSKFLIQSLRPVYFTQARYSDRSSPALSQTELNFGNFLGLNFTGEANDGNFIAGPAFFFSEKEVGFAGMRQTWYRKYNDKFGLVLGDSFSQLNRLNTGGQVFGTRFGTPKNIGISQDNVVTLQGSCATGSEVLLIINNQQISRQVCTNGSYQITYVPRLVDVNNEYRVVQRNVDGSDLVLREERFNYFGDLLQKNQKSWQVFAGTPPLELFNQRSSISLKKDTESSQPDVIPRKAVTGGQFQYGLSDRLTLEGVVAADRFMRSPGEPLLANKILPLTNDIRFLEGETLSLGLYARPKNNFGLRLGTALSHSTDPSSRKLTRTGVGNAFSLDYDWRFKTFTSVGNFFYMSPEFYTPNSPSGNIAGGNISLNGIYKKNFFRVNAFSTFTNLDRKSANGLQQRNTFAFNHSYRPDPNTSVQNNLVYRELKNDNSNVNNITYRTFVLKNVNKRFSATAATRLSNNKSLKPTTQTNFLGELTLGGVLFLDKRRRSQISNSFSLDTDEGVTSFTQLRWRYKNWVYQPSITYRMAKGGIRNYRIANGLFWQPPGSSRVGFEYAISNFQSPFRTFDEFGALIVAGKNKSVNHSVALNVQTVLGFVDNKPRILSNTQTGYIRGKAFLDTNNNGKYDNGEQVINQAKMKIGGKVFEPSKAGDSLATDVSKGIHKISLDPQSIPMTLRSQVDFINVKVEPGKTTEIFFPLKIDSATIEGRVIVKGSDGTLKSASNIVVLATDLNGKEVTYTYTDSNGYYVLSDLVPGDYIVRLDKSDVEVRKLVLSEPERKVNLPLRFDDFIEVKGVNFEAKQTVFGIN